MTTPVLGTLPNFELAAGEVSPVEGVKIRLNPKNKFLVFELHYSADPDKRGEVYRDSIKSSMPLAQYLQEYEIQWDTFIGMPVFRDFQERLHVAKTAIQPELGLPLLRGWDFGLTPSCIVAQLQGNQLCVLYERQEFNMGIERFAELVIPELRIKFPEWSSQIEDWRDFADPSGAFRKDTDEGTCFGILRNQFGLKTLQGGAIDWETRRSSVEDYLLRLTKNGPGLLIDPSCTTLVRGFAGGYRYPEKYEELEPKKIRPIKDEFSHAQDALQMITSSLHKITKAPGRPVKSPGYAFGQQRTG